MSVEPVRTAPVSAKLLDGQHLDRAETGAFGVVGEDGLAHHCASALRRRRRQAVGKADQRAVAVHQLLHLVTRSAEVIGDCLVHDHHQSVGTDRSVYRRQYVNRARHVVNALEREGSIKGAKLGQCLACRDDETRPISNAGRFSVRVCRLDRGFIDIDSEHRLTMGTPGRARCSTIPRRNRYRQSERLAAWSTASISGTEARAGASADSNHGRLRAAWELRALSPSSAQLTPPPSRYASNNRSSLAPAAAIICGRAPR